MIHINLKSRVNVTSGGGCRAAGNVFLSSHIKGVRVLGYQLSSNTSNTGTTPVTTSWFVFKI